MDARLPLYARIRDSLAGRIAAQEWDAGEAIPPEGKLARHYGTSVHTVRRAVEQLVREGLLERRQGSGTYVRRPAFNAHLFRLFHITSEEGDLTVPESRLVQREVMAASDEVAEKLGIPKGGDVLHILRVRLWASEPVVVEDLYLPLPLFARLKDISEAEIGPLLYPFYEREFGCLVAQTEDELFVSTADRTYGMLLDIEPGSPVVIVERSSLRADGSVIEWRRARGRADRFRYKIRQS